MQYACCGWKVENVVKGKMWFMRNNEKGKLWDICQHLSETAFFCGGGMIIIKMMLIIIRMIIIRMIIIIVLVMILLLSDGPISGANRGVFVRGQWPVGRFLSLTFSLHFWQSFYQLLFSLFINFSFELSHWTTSGFYPICQIYQPLEVHNYCIWGKLWN